MQYSSFMKRVFALLLDLIVINGAIVLIGGLAAPLLGAHLSHAEILHIQSQIDAGQYDLVRSEDIDAVMQMALVYSIVSVAVVLIVDAILPATSFQTTPGKRALNMLICDERGQRIGYGHAIGRHAAKLLSLVTVVGALMPLWQNKKQALHDQIAKTVVVNRHSVKARAS